MNLLTIFCYYNKKEKTRDFRFFTYHKPPNKPVTFVSMRTEWIKKKTNTELCSDEYFQNLIRILGFSTVRQLEIDSEWKEVSTAAFEITKIWDRIFLSENTYFISLL